MTPIKNDNTIAERVQAGVLRLNNVSVKDAGRTISAVYNGERESLLDPFAAMVREGLLKASPTSSSKLQGYMRDLRMADGVDMIPLTGQVQLYNSFAGDLKNVLAVAKADKRYEEAWKRIITSLEVSTISLRQQLGREVRIATGYNWYYDVFPELLFSPLLVTERWESYSRDRRDYHRYGYLSMDAATRTFLSDLFFGKEFRLPHLSPELPKGMKLLIENFEQSIATDLMMLGGVALNGSMLSANGSISAAAVKKVKTQTRISDFLHPAGKWPLDRVEMLCLTYFTLLDEAEENGRDDIDIKQLAKFAVDEMSEYIIGPMFSTFLPSMQGFTKTWTTISFASCIADAVVDILTNGMKEWLSLDNFKMQLLCSPIDGDRNFIQLKLFTSEERRKGSPVRKADKENGIANPVDIDWGEEVGLKFAIHWIKYLCALGIVEIAVDPDWDDSTDDPMEGMRYARLTALGRYALNFDVDYTPKAAEGSAEVEFDSQNGILTIDAQSPFQMFLEKVAKRISPTRFKISVDSLLKGCRNGAELEQRISNLRTIINPEKEPEVRKIIEEAMRHTCCATREGGYSLLRLRPDLQGLREAILTNKELREMTILAGPTLALVKTHKMERFNAICASYGYLME